MRAADVVTASILMALGGIVLVDAVRLGFRWGPDGPQSGFFPFWLATLLLFACALIIVQAARRKATRRFATREQLVRVLKVVAPAAGMVLLTQLVGLYVAAALYMGFYMRWVGRHSWGATVLLPISVSLVTFLVFERWFLVPLPKGPLETWLGY
jgi:putative tricarboxylic transport membrane protein